MKHFTNAPAMVSEHPTTKAMQDNEIKSDVEFFLTAGGVIERLMWGQRGPENQRFKNAAEKRAEKLKAAAKNKTAKADEEE